MVFGRQTFPACTGLKNLSNKLPNTIEYNTAFLQVKDSLLTMISLHLAQFYLLLQLNTQRLGFHLLPDGILYQNALKIPDWTMFAHTHLQRHSLNRPVSWEERREYYAGHCAVPGHLACNLYGKLLNISPFFYTSLRPQEVRTKFNQIKLKNWFMLSVRISSYGCTREVQV